jgi:hypothetical protein
MFIVVSCQQQGPDYSSVGYLFLTAQFETVFWLCGNQLMGNWGTQSGGELWSWSLPGVECQLGYC